MLDRACIRIIVSIILIHRVIRNFSTRHYSNAECTKLNERLKNDLELATRRQKSAKLNQWFFMHREIYFAALF